VDSDDASVWESAYVPALTEVLNISEDELVALNLCSERRKYRAVGESDLERIRQCPFVIVDTSGSSNRASFLLGCVAANRKHAVHLCRQDAPPSTELARVPVRRYRDAREAAEYLRSVVGYLVADQARRGSAYLRDFLVRCGLPLAVLEGDGNYGYSLPSQGGERPIYVSMEHSKWQPPEPWRSEFQRVHLRQLEYANSTGAVLFNGDLIRVLDFTPLRDERLGTRGLRLTCQPTDYFTFVSSNHCWDLIGTEAGQRLQAMESQHVTNLRRSVLANPLTVSVSLVIRDAHREWLLVQHRNRDKNFHGKQDFVSAAAGMVSATRDVRSGEIDVYATVCNELREETGVHAREDQVLFLGLLRETSLREIGLVAEVALDGDPHELLGPRADPFESTGFELCEATPEAFAGLLRRASPIERFAPMGAGAITFSLLRRFSRERIESVLGALPGRSRGEDSAQHLIG